MEKNVLNKVTEKKDLYNKNSSGQQYHEMKSRINDVDSRFKQ